MIEFAESENREMLEEDRKYMLRQPYKVEVGWPENGGLWVGVTGSAGTMGHKFDPEDTIGMVRDWILDVRLGTVAV